MFTYCDVFTVSLSFFHWRILYRPEEEGRDPANLHTQRETETEREERERKRESERDREEREKDRER